MARDEADLTWLLLPAGSAFVEAMVGKEFARRVNVDVACYFTKTGSSRYVWSKDGVALAGLQVMAGGGNAVAANVYTLPQARRHGLATKLWRLAARDFPTLAASEHRTRAGAAFVQAVEPRKNPMLQPSYGIGLVVVGSTLVLVDTRKLAAWAKDQTTTPDYLLGMIDVEDAGAEVARLSAAWAVRGWGPLMHELAITFAHQRKFKVLEADEQNSPAEVKVWRAFSARKDVTSVGEWALKAVALRKDFRALQARVDVAGIARNGNLRRDELNDLILETAWSTFQNWMRAGGGDTIQRRNPTTGSDT